MYKVPECLNRRYQALDDLVNELDVVMPEVVAQDADDPSIRLMCNLWNILKEDPYCDLTEAVQQKMGVNVNPRVFQPQRVTCYMAKTGKDNKNDSPCCSSNSSQVKRPSSCCSPKNTSVRHTDDQSLPLTKVLVNLKQAASQHKKCNEKITELLETEQKLQEQIQHLEHRETEGVQRLKQADCMWSCMEDAYKKKIAESMEKQKNLMAQMKEIDKSSSKWRKNVKELEFQLDHISKCEREISEKINQKTNDLKCMDVEIENIKKRLDISKSDYEKTSQCLICKKQSSDAKIAGMLRNVKELERQVTEERKHKNARAQEGAKFIKEARNDLTKISKLLVQKQIEAEDLESEKQALEQDIAHMNESCTHCKERCKNRDANVTKELKDIEKEIAGFQNQCLQCHQCIDTSDVRQYCKDCPKCTEDLKCITKEGKCYPDPANICICTTIKRKLIDNVFENMASVLNRQALTKTGKCIANTVMCCLKNSKNGKLDAETRKLLQNFMLRTIKRNLNLTIVGGAVKTRCEMDPDTYKHLMGCLNSVKVTTITKVDEGTSAKKPSCGRWGGPNECNCPNGPKFCICARKAPPAANDPTPCPTKPVPPSEVVQCPHKDKSECGPDCGMQGGPTSSQMLTWRPDPCKAKTCKFPGNMRAAQCVLGPEPIMKIRPDGGALTQACASVDTQGTCVSAMSPCSCSVDDKNPPRERFIEEVMGKYFEVSPIVEVPTPTESMYRGPDEVRCITVERTKNAKVGHKISKPTSTTFTVTTGVSTDKERKESLILIKRKSEIPLKQDKGSDTLEGKQKIFRFSSLESVSTGFNIDQDVVTEVGTEQDMRGVIKRVVKDLSVSKETAKEILLSNSRIKLLTLEALVDELTTRISRVKFSKSAH